MHIYYKPTVKYRHIYEKVKVLVAYSCLTLCDPVVCGLPGSSVQGILQARIWECSHSFLQRIFLTQESNPSLLLLLHWQVDSLPLSTGEAHTYTHIL